jgi:hypothetical protein
MADQLARRLAGPSIQKAQGLITPGNILTLYNRPATKSPAGPNGIQPGNWSTTFSKSFNFGNGEVLLPTVVNGQFLTDKQAVDRYKATGQHLGIFDTPEHADAFAQALHESQQGMGNFYGQQSSQ